MTELWYIWTMGNDFTLLFRSASWRGVEYDNLGRIVKNRWEVWEEITLFECTELNYFLLYCLYWEIFLLIRESGPKEIVSEYLVAKECARVCWSQLPLAGVSQLYMSLPNFMFSDVFDNLKSAMVGFFQHKNLAIATNLPPAPAASWYACRPLESYHMTKFHSMIFLDDLNSLIHYNF